MTIGTSFRNDAVGNDSTAIYSYNFKIFAATDLVVVVREIATGQETVLSHPSHYTVSGVGAQTGGSITLVDLDAAWQNVDGTLKTGYAIAIRRVVSNQQATDIRNQGDFFASVHEDTFDYLVMIDQAQQDSIDRALKLPQSEAGSASNTSLPSAAQRALKFLGFDSNGNPIAASSPTPGTLTVSAFIETILDDADAKTARQTLLLDKKGSDIGTAGTVNLDAATGDIVDLTGSTTVTAITLAEGVEKKTRTTGTPQFTHGASLILPDALNIVAAAGDIQVWRGYASSVVRLVDYFPVGTANEVDAAENDVVLVRDTSASKYIRVLVQNLFNAIGGMTAFSGDIDIDNDTMVIHDNSQSAPKQRKLPARIGQVPVRQTALAGNVSSSGSANFLTTGSGLRPGLLATSVPLVLTAAAGYDSLGEKNYIERIAADVSDILGANLPASNTSYLYRNLAGAWGFSLVPPQYGYAFDRTQNALLHFDGSDASTTMLDDFGNTWTASGNAQLDTAQSKFGSASLLLDGTGDFIATTDITSLGPDSWEMSIWYRLNATSVLHGIICAENASGFGITLSVEHNAGARRYVLRASSNGTSHDIANVNSGGAVTINLTTWYKARLVFDALAGTYRVYHSDNGAAEAQAITVSSTAKICSFTHIRLGEGNEASVTEFNGWLDEFRLIRAATVTATETPKASAFGVAETQQIVHWFNLADMKMYEIQSASGSAGVNPGMNSFARMFAGEADTSGAAVTAVRSYALRGHHEGALATIVDGTPVAINHNIGVIPLHMRAFLVNATTELGFDPGDRIAYSQHYDAAVGSTMLYSKRNVASWNNGSGVGVLSKTGTTAANITKASWRVKIVAERGW